MARRGQPVLYELLGSPSSASRGTHGPVHVGDPPSAGSSRQSIRVPIGWFWLSAVLALALMAVAWKFGFASGERQGFTRGQEWSADGDAQRQLAGETPDPSGGAAPGSQGAGAPRNSGGENRGGSAEPPRGASKGAPTGGGGSVGAGGSPLTIPDPRVRGMNYWVVARPGADEAAKIADFVRSNGLEVAVVSDNNARFLRIIALPGFEAGSDLGRTQEAKIRAIGKSWKNAARGNRDFDDTYAEKYR